MDNTIWVKTILSAYTKLPQSIMTINKAVDTMSFNFFGVCGGMGQFDKLLKVIKRKKNMEYAILLVKDIMRKLGKEKVEIVYLRFVKKMGFREIAEYKEMNIRTVFRKFDSEVNSFALEMKRRGIDVDFCEKEWGDDILFKQEMQKIEENFVAYNKESKIFEQPIVIVNFEEACVNETIKTKVNDESYFSYYV